MPTNTLKKFLLIALIGSVILLPSFSHAQSEAIQQALEKSNASLGAKCTISNWWGCIQGGAEWIGTLLGLIPAMIAGMMIGWGAELINFMIELSRNLLQLDPTSPGFNILLKTGFGITLDIANLGFVLAIIVIAFATMFRLESYAMKQTLWKLIAAALLVNFSLPLAGLIIDFTNVLAYFFINQGSGGGASFANFSTFTNNIVAAFQPQRAFVVADGGPLEAGFGALLGLLITPILITIFSLITAIVVLTFGFMLLVRYVWLEILLVVMPLAWLMWIFPNLSHFWSKWWSNFIKWNFFLPAATFFVYLALVSTSQIGEQINSRAGDPQIAQAVSSVTIMKDSISVFLQLMIMSGMMVGGLWAASEMGIKAADTGMAWAKGVKNTFVGAAGKIAKAPAKYFGQRLARGTANLASNALTQGRYNPLRLIPGAGTAANTLAGIGARKEDVESYQKATYSNLSNDQVKTYLKAPLPAGPVAKAALLAEASKRGLINKDNVTTTAKMKDLASAARSTNPPGTPPESIAAIKEIINVDPTLAPELTKTKERPQGLSIQSVVSKIAAKKAAEIDKDALANWEVVSSLSQSHVSAILREGTIAQIENMNKTLSNVAGAEIAGLSKQISGILKLINEAKIAGEDVKVKGLQTQLRTAKDNLSVALVAGAPQQKTAYEKLQLLNQNIGRTSETS